MGRSPSQQGHRHERTRRVPYPELLRRERRNQPAAASCCREGFTKLSRFSLTKFGIQLFCVFRDKRVRCTQAAGVLPGLRVEPTLVRLMTKVGLCRVPERTVIFDSLVLGSRHDTDVRLRPFGHGGINPTRGFQMWERKNTKNLI